MKALRETGLLFHRYTVQMLRNPVWLFVGFSTPILYLVLFTPLFKQALALSGCRPAACSTLPPGILALLAFASGTRAGFGTIFELQAGVIERFRVTPASRFAILVGPILSGLTMMMVFDAVVVAVGAPSGSTSTCSACSCSAFCSGSWLADGGVFDGDRLADQGDQQLRRGYQRDEPTMLLLAGVLLPDLLGPLWMRVLAHLNPLFYWSQASRVLAAGSFVLRRCGRASPSWYRSVSLFFLGHPGVPQGRGLSTCSASRSSAALVPSGMRRFHLALAVSDLEATIEDYTRRLGSAPVAVVPGKYALWRTPEINLSINSDASLEQRLRHVGFEDDDIIEKEQGTDVNGLMWEAFNAADQDAEIVRAYGQPR